MRYLILFCCLIIGAKNSSMAQNPYWAFPPNYVDFTTNPATVKPLVSGGTITKSTSANSIFSPNGSLLFYTNGRDLYTRNNGQFTNYVISPSFTGGDISLLPVTNSCNTFRTLGINLVPELSAVNRYKLTSYFEMKFNSGFNGSCNTGLGNSNEHGIYLDQNIATAVSKTTYESYGGSEVMLTTPYSSLYVCGKEGSNVTLNKYELPSNTLKGSVNLISNSSLSVILSEVELFENGTGDMLAVALKGSSIIYLIVGVKQCLNNCSQNVKTISITPNISDINGIEFSNDGKRLYFTKSTLNASDNQISYVDISSVTVNSNSSLNLTPVDVANSQGLGSSFLELATDGYMYVSNGTSLKGFNPNVASPSVTRTINVSNSGLYNGIYTLPDQIDRADYRNLNSSSNAVSGPVYITDNTFGNNTNVNGDVFIIPSENPILFSSLNTYNVTSSTKIKITNSTNSVRVMAGNGTKSRFYISSPIGVNCASNNCSSSSFREEEPMVNETKFSPYPNPIAGGVLYFGKQVTNFRITDNLGNVLLKGQESDKVNVHQFTPGLYLLELDDVVHKISIQ